MRADAIPWPTGPIVHIWLAGEDQFDLDSATRILSQEERNRAERRFGLERRRFIAAHAALRQVVARYHGVDPEDAALDAPFGRAPAARGGPSLSLSHTGEWAVVAVAACPVGVDLEERRVAQRLEDDLDGLLDLTTEPRERAALALLEPETRAAAWLRFWTRKEAWLKAHELGLPDRSPATLDVSPELVEGCALRDLPLDEQLVGAVAIRHSELRLVWKGALA